MRALETRTPTEKNTAYDVPLVGPDDMPVRPTFKRTKYDRPIIDGNLVTKGFPPSFVETLVNNPERYGLVVPILGGATFLVRFGEDNLVDAINQVVVGAGLANEEDFEIKVIAAHDDNNSRNPHAAPIALVIEVKVEGLLDALEAIATFSCEGDLAFHVIRYRPELRTWSVALFTATSGGGSAANGENLRWVMANHIVTDPDVRRAFERARVDADQRSTLVRLIEFAESVDTCWNPHSKQWCVYAKPCSPYYPDWEAVRMTLRCTKLEYAPAVTHFLPVAKKDPRPPNCKVCKNDNHLHFGCTFQLDNPENWWGPTANDPDDIKEGRLGKRSKGERKPADAG